MWRKILRALRDIIFARLLVFHLCATCSVRDIFQNNLFLLFQLEAVKSNKTERYFLLAVIHVVFLGLIRIF